MGEDLGLFFLHDLNLLSKVLFCSGEFGEEVTDLDDLLVRAVVGVVRRDCVGVLKRERGVRFRIGVVGCLGGVEGKYVVASLTISFSH